MTAPTVLLRCPTKRALGRFHRSRIARRLARSPWCLALAVTAGLLTPWRASADSVSLVGSGFRSLTPPFGTVVWPEGAPSGASFAGSHALFRFHKYDVASGSHGVFVRQEIRGGRSVTTGFSSSLASRLRTDTGTTPPRDYHYTPMRAFVVIQGFQGLAPRTRWQSFAVPVNDAHLATELATGTRILFRHACRIQHGCVGPGSNTLARVALESIWTVGGSRTESVGAGTGKFYRPIFPPVVDVSEWGPGFPARLEDGFQTGDPSPHNNAHVATYGHRYYLWSPALPLDCGPNPCKLARDERNWAQHGHVEPWGAEGFREDAPLAVFDVIPVGAAGIPVRPPPPGQRGQPWSGSGRWHVCMGDVGPETPCNLPMPDPAACSAPEHLGSVSPLPPAAPVFRCTRIVVACFTRFPVSTPQPDSPYTPNPDAIFGSHCGACCKKDMDDTPAAYGYAASQLQQYGCLVNGYGFFQVVGEGPGGRSGGWYAADEVRISMDNSDPAYAAPDVIERYVPRGIRDGQEVCWGTEGYSWVRHIAHDLPRTCPSGTC